MKASISMGLHNSDRTKITAGGVGGIVFQFFSVFFLISQNEQRLTGKLAKYALQGLYIWKGKITERLIIVTKIEAYPIQQNFYPSLAKEAVISAAGGTSSSRSR
jgi:hypothetical protein